MSLLAHQTRVAVQVIIQDDTGSVAAFFLAATALIGLLVRFGNFVTRVARLIGDIVEAVSFTAKVFTIGFKALAFGLGVRL